MSRLSRYQSSAAFAVGLAFLAGSVGNVLADDLTKSPYPDTSQPEHVSQHQDYIEDFSSVDDLPEYGLFEEEPETLESDESLSQSENFWEHLPEIEVGETELPAGSLSTGFNTLEASFQFTTNPEPTIQIIKRAEAFSGVPEEYLLASQKRFKRTFAQNPKSQSTTSPKVASHSHLGHSSLNRDASYGFVDGDLVEIKKSNMDFDQKINRITKNTTLAKTVKVVINPKSSISENPNSKKTFPLKGRVSIPAGLDPKSVVLQLGGTSLRARPNDTGEFSFKNVPFGSNVTIAAWDENNQLNRRLYSVSHHTPENNHKIGFVKTSLVDHLSAMFGSPQQLNLSGFCGRLEGIAPYDFEGALIEVRDNSKSYPVYYFNDFHLPDRSLTGLSLDGRFCSFNIDSPLPSVLVQLPNGKRRRFVIPFKASTFEHNLNFPISQDVYLPVDPLEYVDSGEAFLADPKTPLLAGGNRLRDFLRGVQSPLFAYVSQLIVNTDKTYQSVWANPNHSSRLYFPVTQDFTEVYSKSANPNDLGTFELFSSHTLLSQSEDEALKIHSLGDGIRDAMARSLEGLHFNWDEKGSVFLDLDLVKMGVQDQEQISIAIRDPWTAKPVGSFHSLPTPEDVKKPRFMRGFFTDIPDGQYTLVVMNQHSEVKWLDTIRSYQKSLQVVRVGY